MHSDTTPRKDDSVTDYYEILGCANNATHEELKRAYHELALKYHPDKLKRGTHNISTENSITLINEAWKTLKDPEERKRYDEKMLQNAVDQENFVYTSLKLDEMHYNPHQGAYSYICRCGGLYEVLEQDLRDTKSYLIGCDNCSFTINVTRD